MTLVYPTPSAADDELEVLNLIESLRAEMRRYLHEPRRWAGSLRRMTFARAVQGSNSIEGYNASLDDVVAAVEGEPTLDATEETQLALAGYRDAMTYVLQLSQDPQARVDEGLLKALHFMMIKHDLGKNPGRWRPGAIFVRNDQLNEIVYEGPPGDDVPELIAAMIRELEASDAPVLIKAAIAHLNLVMVHPFSDGNGRMGRCLQTLVIAREQTISPVFSSIEEYLGRNTQSYYDILAATGHGEWHPEHDPRPWVRYCLTAHYRQAQTHLRRITEAEDLWVACSEQVAQSGLPERAAAGLYDAAHGLRLRNAIYRKLVDETSGEEISDLTASRDLKAIVEAGFVRPVGDGRGRYYLPTERTRELRHQIRRLRPPPEMTDPFIVVAQQMSLDI